LMINLDKPDFLEVKWGKSRLYIQVGEWYIWNLTKK
jgi:hypothetical protein